MKAFEALKQACMTAPVLTFIDYTKLFLLETDVSQNFTIHQGASYLSSTPKGKTEDLLLFVIPKTRVGKVYIENGWS